MSGMHLKVKEGQSIKVGDAVITVNQVQSGRHAVLCIDAPRSVPIIRDYSPLSEQEHASLCKEPAHGQHSVRQLPPTVS